ncbi:hypothetical protein LTR37_006258 [Vermiconidia calcicola]|uniref:Uncharacterized protein n=1 Tax=Vermiconidia calcicola TaxID=1690605 RepID=A0ACC3NH43_9PEZI|nr:hypothetical protein LTR37_006258 [Vermiconidia calcicola]
MSDFVEQVDKYLEAVIEVNPEALQIAERLDNERTAGGYRGILHGLPVLVKDNMATKDLVDTTAGSWALVGSKVPRDAFVVSKLIDAGAVILGHSNMSEWASVRSKQYSTGFSPRRGQTRNPYDLSKSPFGSSSGSAVAVAANYVPLSFGTETDTSIIGPARSNGIVGIKPTVGLTSRSGVIPISLSMDSVGSLGRTVADAVYGLDAIVGIDERDPATLQHGRRQEARYANYLCDSSTLKGAVFGLPYTRFWDTSRPDYRSVVDGVLNIIRAAGAEVVRTDFPSAEERFNENGEWNWEHGGPQHSEFTVVKAEAYNGINQYLSELSNTEMRSVEDVLAYNKANNGTEGATPGVVPAFPTGQDNFNEIVAHAGRKNQVYHSALTHIQTQSRKNGVDAALTRQAAHGAHQQLDAILICDDKGAGQQLAAQAGYPIITIPIGLDDRGLPVGLSIHHTAWEEGKLVKWASAIEDLLRKESGWRALPKYHNYMSKNIPIGK